MTGRAVPSWDELLDIAREGLEREALRLDEEQAVRGLDALDEAEVQPILAGAFQRAGYGVFREFPYFVPEGAPARGHERERCDLVLTPSPGLPPRDAVADRRARAELSGTLFAGALVDAPPAGAEPEETLWIEVKVAGQFAYAAGVPGPSRAYSSLLVNALRQDVAKLASEEARGPRAVLLVLFAESRRVTDHDVPAALHRCLDAGLPAGDARGDGFAIRDRIGNSWCSLWVAPVR